MLKSILATAFAMCLALAAHAQSVAADTSLPAGLKDWRSWVLKDLDYRACPFIATQQPNSRDTFLCAWPGRLGVTVADGGMSFSIHWRIEAAGWVPLPGDDTHWPQQVLVNGQHAAVLLQGGGPSIWMEPGNADVSGRIGWDERPQSIRVPNLVALVALSVEGKSIEPVQRNGDEIMFGRNAAATPQADSMDVRVYRQLADGVPATLTTRIVLSVAGQAREEIMGPALPAGFVPTALQGTWPARIDDDGHVHVQVQPGSDTLTLSARATAPLDGVTAVLPTDQWARQEIWSYAAAPRLRVTSASGVVQIDPRQAEVPADWAELPAFALGNGDKLVIEQRSRGLAADEGNRLILQREAWLNFAGDGWFARDHIGGSMVQGWRLDVAAPYVLERASDQGAGRRGNAAETLLVTHGAKPELSGVEWRTPSVDLAAGVRIAPSMQLPVAGWQQTFDRVDTTLHFPFGYKLLAAPGADVASGSWVSGWTLLDAFVCAIIVLLAWRLAGFAGAAIAVAYLVLGYQEADSPMWILLAALSLTLVARALPQGLLARCTRIAARVALLVLVIAGLPFAADQLRFALYPQLESGSYARRMVVDQLGIETAEPVVQMEAPTPMSTPAPPPPMESGQLAPAQAAGELSDKPQAPVYRHRMESPQKRKDASVNASPSVAKVMREEATGGLSASMQSNRAAAIDHYSQSTVVQTGRGEPAWNLGSTASLGWSGPVVATQQVRLVIAPPWLVRPLRVVLVVLLVWLMLRLLRSNLPGTFRKGWLTGATAIVLGGLGMFSSAQAQSYPPNELLQQLHNRLTEMPHCAPNCGSLADLQVSATGDAIGIVLEAHVAERVGFPLPIVDDGALLKSIKVDGVANEAVLRDGNAREWIELNRGVHRVELQYAAVADKIALSFALPPGHAQFHGQAWETTGIADQRLLTGTLTLARVRDAASTKASSGVQQFPPYVRVDRSIALGLEWTMHTHVERMSPAQGGIVVSIPVLAKEHIVTPGIKVAQGNATIAIADGADGADWDSTLDKGDALSLIAPTLADRAEVWHALVSPTWHVEFSGVPGVAADAGENSNDYRNFEFDPLPGETLSLKISRPGAADGASRAIDIVSLSSQAGQRAASHTLNLSMRSSQGGEYVLGLPAAAEVLSVSRDGQVLNVRPIGGKLSIPLVPGLQRISVNFRDDSEMGWLTRTPDIALGMPSANIDLQLRLPADRWLLATYGPTVGPAVLYWGELIVMIAVAFALSRTRRTSLRFRHWLLLGLGFSTFSWIALILVVAWLFAFDWRARSAPIEDDSRFKLVQIALATLTAVALMCLISAIPQGLLGQPDMHVTGNGSSAQVLHWFADRSTDALQQGTALSLPMWTYKLLMLLWALWLANALIGWLRLGFNAWSKDGYWRTSSTKTNPAIVLPENDPQEVSTGEAT